MRFDSKENREREMEKKKRQITIYGIIYYLMPFIFLDSLFWLFASFYLSRFFVLFWTKFLFHFGHFSLFFAYAAFVIYYIYIWINAVLIARVSCIYSFQSFDVFMKYEERVIQQNNAHEWNVMRTFFCLLSLTNDSVCITHIWSHIFSLIDFISSFFSPFFSGRYGIQL